MVSLYNGFTELEDMDNHLKQNESQLNVKFKSKYETTELLQLSMPFYTQKIPLDVKFHCKIHFHCPLFHFLT